MKLLKKILFFLFLTAHLTYAQQKQENPLVTLQQNQLDYFKLNREYVFLHLNKTQVAPRESLWFSAYVYDLRTNMPNLMTTNLHVALFNEAGNQVAYKTIFIHQGTGEGWFELPKEEFKPGTYYIKASTYYMQNFREDLSFTQTFEILGKSEVIENKKEPILYDLQLLPEGGHLIADVNNIVGVKLINQHGKGVFFTEAKVTNEKGKFITSFKSNQFGIARFSINPSFNKNYNVKLKTEFGDSLTVPLPKIKKTGVILKVNNFLQDKILLSLETNKESLPRLTDKKFYITYHQQHRFKGFQISFSSNSTAINLPINREFLFPGMNVITIFDELANPILERLIFNPIEIKRKTVNAAITKNLIDSLVVQVRSNEKLDSLQQLSISVLPKKTKAYQPNYNILSSFLLKPYVKSTIENSSYYFNEPNKRKRLYDLDLLLLTQGWSKYNWKNIHYFSPKENYKSEAGFTLSGTINNRDVKDSILFITSKANQLMEVVEIQPNYKFETKNLFIKDSSSIHFGLFNNRNGKVIRSNYAASVLPFKKQSRIEPQQTKSLFYKPKNLNLAAINSESFIKSTVSLDTVLVKGSGKKEETPVNEGGGFNELIKIDEAMRNQYQYITDYIATQNFNVVRTPTGGISIKSRRVTTIHGNTDTMIILDGLPLTHDLDIIAFMLTSQVESIRINKSGFGYGAFGGNGVIEINTRTDYSSDRTNTSKLFSFTTNNGFAVSKEFYIPKYANYTSDLFLEYGTIHWEPKVELNKNKQTTSFKIPNTLTKNITLFIEGMSQDGYLISEEIDLDVP